MADLPETPIYDAGVYQKETTDIALGGPDGKANAGARNLANRTAYLKQHLDSLETIVPQAEAEAGTATTVRAWTALRVRQAINVAVAAVVNSAPTVLDTLSELAAALGNDANFATTITTALAAKAPLESPALTGNPTAPTAALGANTTQLANTAFIQASKQFNFIDITSSGNFTTPANITTATVFEFTLVGGGAGAGGVGNAGAVSAGGGCGGAAKFLISGLSPSTAYAVIIGAYGVGGDSSGGNGGNGGTTQITINGTVYSCNGGYGGPGTVTALVNIAAPQGAVSPTILALPHEIIYQQSASIGFANVANEIYVGCNGGGLPYGTAGVAARSGNGTPDPTSGYGVGGGGAFFSAAGGNGAPGLLEARWVA